VTHVVDNVLGSIDPQTMHASDVSINATAIRVASRVLDADALVPASLCQRFSTFFSSKLL
jgi:hypothetical protein